VVDNQRSTGEWGKTLGKKQGLTLWIAFQNIGGFLKDDEMDMKFEAVRRFITKHNIDIFGFTEMNTCWDVLDESMRPATHTRGWWESCRWVLSHNHTEEHLQQYQPGGHRYSKCQSGCTLCTLPGRRHLGVRPLVLDKTSRAKWVFLTNHIIVSTLLR